LTQEKQNNQVLMDRIQSGDLKTFLSLRTTNSPLEPYEFPKLVSQTDEAELARLGQAQGIGYELNDDAEFTSTLAELGIDEFIERDSER
jgi:hypothetical protein